MTFVAKALFWVALSGAGLAMAEEVPPPRLPGGEALAARMAEAGIDSALTYAVSAELAAPAPIPPPEAPRPARPGLSAWWVLALVALGLVLWLRFGGTGMLARRAPQEGTLPARPDWQVETAAAPALLDQIAAMEDRSAALVRLLRHCLLRVAETSGTRLARSDTEREAFARLPRSEGLALILQAAELAHYGGRPVGEAEFQDALLAGRSLLGLRHG